VDAAREEMEDALAAGDYATVTVVLAQLAAHAKAGAAAVRAAMR
jgi:hypothetical protein